MLTISAVGEPDLAELLPMMRGYCDFYRVDPGDDALIAMSRALITDPGDGVQLIARAADATPVGFATIFWTWQTLYAARVGVVWETAPENVTAQRLYDRLGAQRSTWLTYELGT